MLKFWIRGQSVSIFAMCYLLLQVSPAVAVPVATAATVAIGLLSV